MSGNARIKESHLARGAYVYVRQSTEHQVQHHLQSQQRQYGLADLAVKYGWPRASIQVIDEDLGRSGSTTAGRTGFARLVADVALGKAGIVLGLEVSRLARNSRDWYQLLDLCSMTGTLIADADGVYDAAVFNDRLLLGLKGTMSEAELHVLQGRMLAGLQHKATQGRLRMHLPPGYEIDVDGHLVKSPDERVVHMIDLIFRKIFEVGSVSGVLRELQEQGLRLPRKAAYDRAVRWVRPYYRALYSTLTNPIYTGAYVYGRSKVVKRLDAEGQVHTRQERVPLGSWRVVIHDHHPGYVSWDDFLRIRSMIRSNHTIPDQASRVAREGSALLQGLARCGKCGRPMQVAYPGKQPASYARYYCRGAQARGESVCQSIGHARIDAAVAAHFLEEMAPASAAVHLIALRELGAQKDALLDQLELDLERARYEAERIERQYNAVEPENRLVARTLEQQWNDALASVEALQERTAERRRARIFPLLDVEERDFERLANDLPALWTAPSTRPKDRKRLLHAAIDEVQIINLATRAQLKIVWKGGAVVDREVPLPKLPRKCPSGDVVDLLRVLAVRHTDAQIARILIRQNRKTATGLPFNAHRVANLRLRHGIECYREDHEPDTSGIPVDEAARKLGVHRETVYYWIRAGLLKADQLTPGAPWQVHLADEDVVRLTASDAPDGWLPLRSAATKIGVSHQTILNWVKQRKVEYVYVSTGRRHGLRINVQSAPYGGQARLFT